MKKVLILTTSTGEGHNQAANSLFETFQEENFECIKHDFLGSNSKFLNKAIVKGYEITASKFPAIYGFFYSATDNNFLNKLLRVIFNKNSKKLLKYIDSIKPDLIIGTHPLTVNIISKLKGKGMNIPFISVVTDFKAHYTYVNTKVDTYITGSEYTKQSLIDRGINPNIIYPIGIPIKESFYSKDSNIIYIKDKEYFNLLLMSGSMGLENIYYVLNELLGNDNKLRITVVCGNNDALKDHISDTCSKDYPNKKVHILGFSKDIAYLMEYSDLIISKPGGLTVTEAIVKNLPLIIPFAIPGQEMENTEFLSSNGYAYHIDKIKDINEIINYLIRNPESLKSMQDKLKTLASSYSTREIIKIGNDLISKHK